MMHCIPMTIQYNITFVAVIICYHQRCGSSIEYFLLPLPAPYKVSRFRCLFPLSASLFKVLPLSQNLNASASMLHAL